MYMYWTLSMHLSPSSSMRAHATCTRAACGHPPHSPAPHLTRCAHASPAGQTTSLRPLLLRRRLARLVHARVRALSLRCCDATRVRPLAVAGMELLGGHVSDSVDSDSMDNRSARAAHASPCRLRPSRFHRELGSLPRRRSLLATHRKRLTHLLRRGWPRCC